MPFGYGALGGDDAEWRETYALFLLAGGGGSPSFCWLGSVISNDTAARLEATLVTGGEEG